MPIYIYSPTRFNSSILDHQNLAEKNRCMSDETLDKEQGLEARKQFDVTKGLQQKLAQSLLQTNKLLETV